MEASKLSRRAFPDGLLDPPRCTKLWVHGFEGRGLAHGITYFDSQLRRVGLAPGEVDEGSKRELVTILGGHPVALALAADAVFQDGIEEVLSQLRSRGGFWKTYVEQL